MRLSVQCDYAARAVLALARSHATGTAIQAKSLSRRESIPLTYLMRILGELRKGGLVHSLRGRAGGYQLARDPGEITLADVVRCIHGTFFEIREDSGGPRELREGWKRLQTAMEKAAGTISFREIMERAESQPEMYYI